MHSYWVCCKCLGIERTSPYVSEIEHYHESFNWKLFYSGKSYKEANFVVKKYRKK